MTNETNATSAGWKRRIADFVSTRPRVAVLGGLALIAIVFVGALAIGGNDRQSITGPDVKSAADESEVLAADDTKGSPHVVLTEEFDPEANPERKVPDELKKDADEVLTVEEATFNEGTGPYDLVWKLKRKKGDPVSCINCAFVDKRVKSIINATLESDASEGINQIVGLDVTRTMAGDYSGNGWQVEFVVGSSASGYKNGEELATWLLGHSKDNHIYSVLWRNLFYNESDSCTAELETTSPVEAFPQEISTAENSAMARDAGMDRIVVSSPAYTPQFEDRDGAQFVTGWKATGC